MYCIAFNNFSIKQDLAFYPWSFSYILYLGVNSSLELTAILRLHGVLVVRPARVDGSLRFSSEVLSCQWEEIVCFLSFLPVSPWVLQLNGKTSNLDCILIIVFLSFPFTWKELLANCTQVPLVGGSHPGERHIRASISMTRASKGSVSIRTSLKQIECTTSILLTL